MFTSPYPKPTIARREMKRPAVKEAVPLEETEQQTVAEWLDAKGIVYQASAMGAYLHPATFMKLKKIGCKKDHPDIVIYDRPPVDREKSGTAIEMKRRKGSEARPGQLEYLEQMKRCGWIVYVAKGCDDAISFLEALGYGAKKP